jgi:hypothetical protein
MLRWNLQPHAVRRLVQYGAAPAVFLCGKIVESFPIKVVRCCVAMLPRRTAAEIHPPGADMPRIKHHSPTNFIQEYRRMVGLGAILSKLTQTSKTTLNLPRTTPPLESWGSQIATPGC